MAKSQLDDRYRPESPGGTAGRTVWTSSAAIERRRGGAQAIDVGERRSARKVEADASAQVIVIGNRGPGRPAGIQLRPPPRPAGPGVELASLKPSQPFIRWPQERSSTWWSRPRRPQACPTQTWSTANRRETPENPDFRFSRTKCGTMPTTPRTKLSKTKPCGWTTVVRPKNKLGDVDCTQKGENDVDVVGRLTGEVVWNSDPMMFRARPLARLAEQFDDVGSGRIETVYSSRERLWRSRYCCPLPPRSL